MGIAERSTRTTQQGDIRTRDHAARVAHAHRTPAASKQPTYPQSGTDPDDRNRYRDTQAECAENRRDEFGNQTYLLSYAR